jgi:hypothetical protein
MGIGIFNAFFMKYKLIEGFFIKNHMNDFLDKNENI